MEASPAAIRALQVIVVEFPTGSNRLYAVEVPRGVQPELIMSDVSNLSGVSPIISAYKVTLGQLTRLVQKVQTPTSSSQARRGG
jgi:hypothetical protein